MIRPDSQNARVLAVLADGESHSAAEIHRRAGFMRLNSRIAELRSKLGLEIVCEHIGGSGPDAFVYTLLTTGGEAPQPGTGAHAVAQELTASVPSRFGLGSPCPSPASPPVAPTTATPQAATVVGAQLDLFGAAA